MAKKTLSSRAPKPADLSAIPGASSGDLRLAGKRGVFVPTDFLMLVPMSLKSFVDVTSDVMYTMGIMYGRTVVEGLRRTVRPAANVGPDRLFRTAMEYFTRSGWGYLAVKEIDPVNARIRVDSSNLIGVEDLAAAQEGSPRPVDDFTCGIVAGTASAAFGNDLDAVEMECRATGAEACVIVAGPGMRAAKS